MILHSGCFLPKKHTKGGLWFFSSFLVGEVFPFGWYADLKRSSNGFLWWKLWRHLMNSAMTCTIIMKLLGKRMETSIKGWEYPLDQPNVFSRSPYAGWRLNLGCTSQNDVNNTFWLEKCDNLYFSSQFETIKEIKWKTASRRFCWVSK